MSWLILFIAGLFEMGWAVGLKYTEGFSRFWPSVFTGLSMIASVWLLGVAMKSLPISTAYSVWVGVGVVGTVVIGATFLGEPMGLMRVGSIVLVVLGIVGLKVS